MNQIKTDGTKDILRMKMLYIELLNLLNLYKTTLHLVNLRLIERGWVHGDN